METRATEKPQPDMEVGLLTQQSLFSAPAEPTTEEKRCISTSTARRGTFVLLILATGAILLSEFSQICGEQSSLCKGFALPAAILTTGSTIMCCIRGWCSEAPEQGVLEPFSTRRV